MAERSERRAIPWFVGYIAVILAVTEGYGLVQEQVRTLPFAIQAAVLLALIVLLAVLTMVMLMGLIGWRMPSKPITAYAMFVAACLGASTFLVGRTKWNSVPVMLPLVVALIVAIRQSRKQDDDE